MTMDYILINHHYSPVVLLQSSSFSNSLEEMVDVFTITFINTNVSRLKSLYNDYASIKALK